MTLPINELVKNFETVLYARTAGGPSSENGDYDPELLSVGTEVLDELGRLTTLVAGLKTVSGLGDTPFAPPLVVRPKDVDGNVGGRTVLTYNEAVRLDVEVKRDRTGGPGFQESPLCWPGWLGFATRLDV